VETLDLVQFHCPPNEVYYQPETFEGLAALNYESSVYNAVHHRW
jgi:hypothetical protein